MSENEDSKRPRMRSASNSKLPLASVIPDTDTMKSAVKLLKKATANKVSQSSLKEAEEAIQSELAAICEAYELPGIRHGLDMFEYHGWVTRKSLSKEKLLALGVPAATIEAAYTESKPFLSTKIQPFDIE